MTDIDWDDDSNNERWCHEQRSVAAAYMEAQPVGFGQLGDWPAWHIAPDVSIWAIESLKAPGKVGWWVICGDLPTDYASGENTPHPRIAVGVFAKRWAQLAASMERGEDPASFSIGTLECADELIPLLKSRARLLSEWVSDDSVWQDKAQ
ncbi:MAG: DUF4826 family protein [Flavobacteriales bacterium]|nr:DUF4826 family protein [Flavobacteriales bacterium]